MHFINCACAYYLGSKKSYDFERLSNFSGRALTYRARQQTKIVQNALSEAIKTKPKQKNVIT